MRNTVCHYATKRPVKITMYLGLDISVIMSLFTTGSHDLFNHIQSSSSPQCGCGFVYKLQSSHMSTIGSSPSVILMVSLSTTGSPCPVIMMGQLSTTGSVHLVTVAISLFNQFWHCNG